MTVMTSRYLRSIFTLLAGTTAMCAAPASAQMWFDTAAIMMPVVQNPCPGGECNASKDDRAEAPVRLSDSIASVLADRQPPQAAMPAAKLTFRPSMDRRRANLGHFVADMRKRNRQHGDELQQMLAEYDLMGMIEQGVTPLGFDMNNVADAYAFWWLTSWDTAQGISRPTYPQAQAAAVREQARTAMLAAPQFASMSDADKQQQAEALWLQAGLMGAAAEEAAKDSTNMRPLSDAARRGAAQAGLDFSRMTLTETGFVAR